MSKHPAIDQLAHASAAFLGLVPFALAPSPLTGAFAGLVMGFVRELTEEGPLVKLEHFGNVIRSGGSRLDLTFWTLGGLLAGTIKDLF